MSNDIRFVRGDTYHFFLDVLNNAGEVYTPIYGDTLTLTVRVNNDVGAIVLQKTSDSFDVVPTTTGWEVTIQPEDTARLAYVDYVYDIELNLNGYVQTVIPLSKFMLMREVTYVEPIPEEPIV